MAAIEFSCPKCGNKLLCFTCRQSHNMRPSSPKKEEWNILEAKRYRKINKDLEVFDDGNWIRSKNRYMGLSFNGNYNCRFYFCNCGFCSEYEDDFLNKSSISQMEEKIYENGRKYIGQFKNGKREGYGIMYFPDGGRYEGQIGK